MVTSHGLVFLSSKKICALLSGVQIGWNGFRLDIWFEISRVLYTHFLMRPAAPDFIEKTIQRMSSKCCIGISLG